MKFDKIITEESLNSKHIQLQKQKPYFIGVNVSRNLQEIFM